MTYKEYEIIVEKLEERLDCGLITESTAEAINSYCYDKYMESYVDEMIDNLDDEFDESTALSKHIYNKNEDKIKKLKDEKSKVDAQIVSLEKMYKTTKEGSDSKKRIETKLDSLRKRSEEFETKIGDIIYDRENNDTKHLGGSNYKDYRSYGIVNGERAKRKIRKEYNTDPAAPREPGLYKKIHDNK